MRLHDSRLGSPDAPPLLILHGLLGSSRSWLGCARYLAERFCVWLVDLRNHGQSPHDDEHGIGPMVDDILEWLDSRDIERVRIIGHSMGGKVAMRLACRHPQRIEHLTAVDIAPRGYSVASAELAAMRAIDLDSIRSRFEAEAELVEVVPDRPTRLFLLTNLQRREGRYVWKIHLDALIASLPNVRRPPLDPADRFDGPTHFLIGGLSDFVRDEDHAVIREHFPTVRIEVLDASGHNPHIDDCPGFVSAVLQEAAMTGR